ncbi:alpha/beta hydrolase [Bowmanella denitrificans]|uniref:alpha/beta hydrolase n=1 Tax=Bowmanella denitrificans TaxID=366582 RepID=UPI000C9BF5BE|nr:alpha/beta hydrolase-fold protein [Bowmanella denitrificans]
MNNNKTPVWLIAVLTLLTCFRLQGGEYRIASTEVQTLDDRGRYYDIVVKLPASYYQPKQFTHRYPVIYMMDAAYSFPLIAGATQFPMNSKSMEEAILVGIDWQQGLSGNTSRVRDFTPSKAADWRLETGGAQRHLHFLAERVIPFVESRYRTTQAQRTFVGNSLGGLFGLYALLNRPTLFEHYVLGSPSLWYDNKALLSQVSAWADGQVAPKGKVFIGVGELETPLGSNISHDLVGDAISLKSQLAPWRFEDFDVQLYLVPDARHETAFPTVAIRGLSWLFGSSQTTP